MPGFWPALGFALLYLSFILLIPLAALIVRPWELGLDGFWRSVTEPATIAALRLSFVASLIAASINAVVGLIVAWTLTRYEFPGKRFLDALIDLPFAMPTAVAGISLATIYAPTGWVGALFAPFDIRIAYTQLGVLIALIFVGFPFVVRSVQPVLADLERDVEEASATLGASRIRTIVQVVAPAILPSLLAGFGLAFARAVGEYGSVIFIAANLPYVTEIAPVRIIIRLEEFDYAGAASVGLAMLIIAFLIILPLNLAQLALTRRTRG